jgi:hypothetical protein
MAWTSWSIDGDGQMDPSLIPDFIGPILAGADYTKGNRFYDLEQIGAMPPVRLFGNAVLSLLTKLSSGYWHLFDPQRLYGDPRRSGTPSAVRQDQPALFLRDGHAVPLKYAARRGGRCADGCRVRR